MSTSTRHCCTENADSFAQNSGTTLQDSSCASLMTPGLDDRELIEGPEIEPTEPTRSCGGGSSLIHAFSSMFVHFPLVPA